MKRERAGILRSSAEEAKRSVNRELHLLFVSTPARGACVIFASAGAVTSSYSKLSDFLTRACETVAANAPLC